METIYKYHLMPRDMQPVEMPQGARLLSAQYQGGYLCLWAIVDTEAPGVQRSIRIVGTGHDATDCGDYVSTVQQDGLVFHIFDKGEM